MNYVKDNGSLSRKAADKKDRAPKTFRSPSIRITFCFIASHSIGSCFDFGEIDMGDRGSKDKGRKEPQKKAKLTPKEKRKVQKEKKNK